MSAGYRIMFTGPGFLSGTIGTAPLAECQRTAPAMARDLKRRHGCRWVRWSIHEARPIGRAR